MSQKKAGELIRRWLEEKDDDIEEKIRIPMTELSFLIELLLHHELSKETKDLIALRIKEVEEQLNQPSIQRIAYQAPMLPPSSPITAQTPQAAAALAAREAAMHGDSTKSIYKVRPK